MSIIQIAIALPLAALIYALIADFMAGLSEERLWSDPADEDPESYRNRSARSAHISTHTPLTSESRYNLSKAS